MRKALYNTFFLAFILLIGCSREEFINNNLAVDSSTNITETDGPNLLKNAGFENWRFISQYDSPDYWLSHNNGNVRREYNTIFEGYSSAKMASLESGSTAKVNQLVPVTPNSKIRIRFRYYVGKWKENGARTYCYFRTGDTESTNIPISELREFYSNDEYYIIRGGGFGLKYLPHNLYTWITFDQTITVPPSANYFVFGVNSYYETIIYVDDCFVGEISYS